MLKKQDKPSDGQAGQSSDLIYRSQKIVFSTTYCPTDKYSDHRLNTEQAKEFKKRLIHLSGITWDTFEHSGKESGLTLDKKGNGYEAINAQKPKDILTKHYGHFRVGSEVFRTFGFRDDNVFHITHIDRSGKIYRKAHK